MRCAPVIVVRAAASVRQARQQLEQGPDELTAVIVAEAAGEHQYYVFAVKVLRARLSTTQADGTLAEALGLRAFRPVSAGQLGTDLPPGTVALQGRHVIGVMVADTGAQRDIRGDDTTTVRPGPDATNDPSDDRSTRGSKGTVALSGKTWAGRDPDTPTDPTTDQPSLFRAYPDVTAPARVGAGEDFVLGVGFAKEPSPSMLVEGPPILLLAGPRPEFIIQVTGFGFTFPKGTERTLTVDRDDPEQVRVEFAVRADDVDTEVSRFLEISYEFGGVVVGRTWAQLIVTPDAPTDPTAPAPAGGSGLVHAHHDGARPHLGVDIFSEDGGSELRWVFHCAYTDIVRPKTDLTTSLRDHSAQSFAVQLMRMIPAERDQKYLTAVMRGIGKMVADLFPVEFWNMLAQTWRHALADGEQPRLQITLTEPWIPWELALLEHDRFADAAELLPADSSGAALGQLWQVARWTTPTRFLPGGDLPATPPPSTIEANQMAVIIGDYDTPGITKLPNAVDEGNTIAMTYGALPLSVSTDEVAELMSCTLQHDNKLFAPTVLHFAGHGQTDVDNAQFTGLILAGGRRLDPVTIQGFSLVGERQPFVFLNACEAGVAGDTLIRLGGLVGAFLVEGARGFVAPLWKVDDILARQIAIEFYTQTLTNRETVSEAMRQIRRKFTPDSTSATAMAYVYYGNPDLRIEWSAQ